MASGRIVWAGDVVDVPARVWADNDHLAESFVIVEESKQAVPAPKSKKSDKE